MPLRHVWRRNFSAEKASKESERLRKMADELLDLADRLDAT